MLNYFLEVVGALMMFLGMCMEECNGAAFVIQLILVIGGTLIMFIGYTRDRLKYERRQTDKRIAKMKRRKRESA